MSNGQPGARKKLTQERIAAIIEQVKHGVPAYRAAQATGVTERTYFNWTKIGREVLAEYEDDIDQVPEDHDEYLCAFFTDRIAKAEAESESTLVLTVVKESQKQWQAAAWMLERRYPDRYGRRDKVDANINGNLGVSFAENVTEAWKRRGSKTDDLAARRQADTDAATDSDV